MSRRARSRIVRIGLRSCLLAAAAVVGVFASVGNTAGPGGAWPMYGGNAQHTGYAAVNAPSSLPPELWSYVLAHDTGDTNSPVVGPGGVIYVSTTDGVTAVNPNGTLKWSRGLSDVSMAPAVADDGTVYVAVVYPGDVYALDPADGSTKWTFRLGYASYGSPTIGPDGTVYIGSAVSPASLYALNPNGTQKWRWDSDVNCWIESSPAVAPNGNVYVQQNCNGLTALDSSGGFLWNRPGVGDVWVAPSVGPDGTVYIGDYQGISALNPADGSFKWRAATGESFFSVPSISADGSTLFRTGDDQFSAVTSAGSIKWHFDPGTQGSYDDSAAVSANGVVFFGGTATTAGSPYFYALRAADGLLLWQTSEMMNRPALGADGTLYALSGSGASTTLHAFGCGADGDGNGIGDSCEEAFPPETTITAGPSGWINDNTPTYSFSSEPGATFGCRVDSASFAPCTSPFTTEALADGAHTFDVRATDSHGNTDISPASRAFTVDTVPPETTIDSGPTGATNDSTPTFTFSSSQPSSTFACRFDSGGFAACTSPLTSGALADGPHTLEVKATDPAGNTDASPASRAFSIDTTPPQTTIDSGPSGPTNNNSPTFTFSSSEPGSTFQCRTDSWPFATCTTPFVTGPFLDGAHTFEVKATDALGNVDLTPALRSFTVDTYAPNTTITAGPSGYTNDSTPTFEFTSSDAGSAFACAVDSGSYGSCTSPYTTAGLGEGAHTFYVRATDPAGNTDASPASRAFTVDTVAPDTTITSGPSGLTNDSTPAWAFSSSEGSSTFACRIDSGSFATCTSPFTSGTLSEGAHTFQVRATDQAGNPDATPASRSITVDSVAPNTTIDSGPSGYTNDNTPTFTFSATEPGSTFQCRVDYASYATCSSPYTTDVLTSLSHTFDVRAVDAAGNVDPTPANRAFTVDITAPSTSISSGPSGWTTDNTPTFTFTSNETGSTFTCRIDSAPFATCTTPYTSAALGEGAHTFEVTATDQAGNTDATPASRAFTVDTVAPQTTIDSGPSGPTNDNMPTFTFSANEASSTFQCRFDSDAFTSCVSSYMGWFLAEGPHTFEVKATDPAGNPDPTPATRSFVVDTVEPDTTIDSGPSGTTGDSTPTFTFSSTEPGSTFQCRVDLDSYAACESPYTTATLAEGAHYFYVRATDVAGNADPFAASQAFVVDTTAPDTSVDSGPAGLTGDATPTFTFSSEYGASFECRVDSGAYAGCTSPFTTAILGEGPHTFYVRAIDGVGNADPTPASRSFTVDTLAPDTSIDSGPTGTITDSTPTFTFSSEPGATFGCRVDSASFAPCASPYTTVALADGAHTFEVRAADLIGNVDPTPASRAFTVDTTPPQTSIDSGPSGTITDTTPEFAFSSSEPGSTFACKLDSTTLSPCFSPLPLGPLGDGAHTFQVWATDAAGNADPTPASRSFTVDTTPPQTTITSGPHGPTNDNTPTFTFTSSEPGSSFACRVDEAEFVPCVSPLTLGALPEGGHTFEVKATDGVGNTDPTATGRAFRVDTVAPTVTVGTRPVFTLATTVGLSYTGADGGSGVASYDVRYQTARFDGSFGSWIYPNAVTRDWQRITATSVSLPVTRGYTYCLAARSRDAAGNVSAWSARRCTAVALDDRALAASTGWVRGTGSSYYAGTVTRTTTKGVTLTRSSVQGTRIAVVASRGPGSGTIGIYWNGTLIKTVSLYASTTQHRKVITVASFDTLHVGTLVIRTLNTGLTRIDGFAVNRT